MLPTKTLLALLPLLGSAAAACKGPPANDNAVNLIKEFEGSRPTPYDDGSGYMTIGVGHRCEKKDCSDVPYPQPLNDDSITKLLKGDLVVFQDSVTNTLGQPVTLNDNQYGALVSLAFNIGSGNFQKSTLVKRLNAGEDPKKVADEELPKLNTSRGKPVSGLTRRRKAEDDLFNAPAKFGALPAPC